MLEVDVIGAGISGLTAALELTKRGIPVEVHEQSDKSGGLLSSFTLNGYRFDQAIHLSFSKIDEVKRLVEDIPHNTFNPFPMCIEQGLWFRHPVQNDLNKFPIAERVELLESYFNRPSLDPENYKEYLISQYGRLMSKRFFEKYTKKYWGVEPEDMSIDWIGERLRKQNDAEILRGAMEPAENNFYYAPEMKYPKKGGFWEFYKPLFDDLQVSYQHTVVEISLKKKEIVFSNQRKKRFSRIISTMPLPVLVSLIDDCPIELKNKAARLRWTKTALVNIGVSGKLDLPLWFYIYDDDCYASRCHLPSIKSKFNTPTGKSSLQFEIHKSSHDDFLSAEEMEENVRNFCLSNKFYKLEQQEFMETRYIDYANIIPLKINNEISKELTSFLAANDIFVSGRFGMWEYLWSDQCMLCSQQIVANIYDD
jgi:protoporphyrinogen oxidase